MNPSSETRVLNQVLGLLTSSLPMYLAQARPWTGRGQESLAAAVDQMASDRRALAYRICHVLQDLCEKPEWGRFPTEFSDLHDLQVDYLLTRLVEAERGNLDQLASLAGELPADSPSRALVEEAIGNTRGHLDVLRGDAAGTPAQG